MRNKAAHFSGAGAIVDPFGPKVPRPESYRKAVAPFRTHRSVLSHTRFEWHATPVHSRYQITLQSCACKMSQLLQVVQYYRKLNDVLGTG